MIILFGHENNILTYQLKSDLSIYNSNLNYNKLINIYVKTSIRTTCWTQAFTRKLGYFYLYKGLLSILDHI